MFQNFLLGLRVTEPLKEFVKGDIKEARVRNRSILEANTVRRQKRKNLIEVE